MVNGKLQVVAKNLSPEHENAKMVGATHVSPVQLKKK